MSRWPMVPLGEVLHHRKEFVQIDDLQTYQRCRVQLHAQGIVLRDLITGAEIKTKKQQLCRAGEFLVAEIDAKHGGYGIVPPTLDGAIVSSHYFLFSVDETKLSRYFLGYYVKTAAFFDQVAAQGSTNYAAIRPQAVNEYIIPLPPLAEQRRIVEQVDMLAAKIADAATLRENARRERESVIPAVAFRVFDGIGDQPRTAIGKLGVNGENPVQTGPFGAQLHKSEFTERGVPVLNVGNVWPAGLSLGRLDHVSAEKARSLSRYRLQVDDLLFARSGATLGKVCLVPPECDGWLMTGHLFRVRFDRLRCEPRFAFLALRAAHQVRDQVFGQVRGATRPGFNTTLLSRVELPLPCLDEQRRIVGYFERIQAKVDNLAQIQDAVAAKSRAVLSSVLDRVFRNEG